MSPALTRLQPDEHDGLLLGIPPEPLRAVGCMNRTRGELRCNISHFYLPAAQLGCQHGNTPNPFNIRYSSTVRSKIRSTDPKHEIADGVVQSPEGRAFFYRVLEYRSRSFQTRRDLLERDVHGLDGSNEHLGPAVTQILRLKHRHEGALEEPPGRPGITFGTFIAPRSRRHALPEQAVAEDPFAGVAAQERSLVVN